MSIDVAARTEGASEPRTVAAGTNEPLERIDQPPASIQTGLQTAAVQLVVEESRQTQTAVVDPRSPKFSSWSRRYVWMMVLLDVVVGMLSVLISSQLYSRAGHFSEVKLVVLVLGAGLAWPLAVMFSHGYDQRKVGVGDDELRALLHGVVLAIAVGAVPSAAVNKYGVVALTVAATPVAGLLSLVARFVGREYLHHQQRRGRGLRRVVLVGDVSSASELNDVLGREQHHGMSVIGACVPDGDVTMAAESGLDVIGDLENVAAVVRLSGADAVAITGGEAARHSYLKRLSWALEGAGVELLVHPGLVEVAGPRMHIRPYVGLPLLYVEQPHFNGWRRFVKRAFDITMTGAGLMLISPLLLAVSVAIKLDDGGPVLFKQTRVGLDRSSFTMWKFRSMHRDAEARVAELRQRNPGIGLLFKMTDDPRVTRVGRFLRTFSLDELPQLLNALTGSMSLVGPRPPLPAEVDGYASDARRRLLVTPGLTGLWQVSGRSLLSWEETVRLDLRYVENWTLSLDLAIIWKTLFAVLARRGAY